jgi:hypothetical protein
MTARKTFWVMLMCIQALVQFVIHYWTIDFGSDASVVSHLGFAGTLVSIALAVVAIVYAYFQSYSQRRDSEAVATRLAQMRELLTSLNTSSAQIGTYAAFMEQMQAQLGRITTAQGETLATAARIEKSIEDRRAAELTAVQEVKTSAPSEEPAQAARLVISRSAPLILLCLYALAEVAKRNGTMTQYRHIINSASRNTLARQNKDEGFILAMANWVEGIGAGAAFVLQTLDLVALQEVEGPAGATEQYTVALADSFLAEMPNATKKLDRLKEQPQSIDRAGVESAIQAAFSDA